MNSVPNIYPQGRLKTISYFIVHLVFAAGCILYYEAIHFPHCAQYLPRQFPNLKKKLIDLQRIEGSIFSDTYLTMQRAFVAILTSTYLLQYTRFTRLLRRTPSRTEYDKSSTPQQNLMPILKKTQIQSCDENTT